LWNLSDDEIVSKTSEDALKIITFHMDLLQFLQGWVTMDLGLPFVEECSGIPLA
jgi:hypothetical protein